MNVVAGLPEPGDPVPALSVVWCDAPPQPAAATGGTVVTSAPAVIASASTAPTPRIAIRLARD